MTWTDKEREEFIAEYKRTMGTEGVMKALGQRQSEQAMGWVAEAKAKREKPMTATEVKERHKEAGKRLQDINIRFLGSVCEQVIFDEMTPAPLNAAEVLIVGKDRKFIQVTNGLSDMTPLEADKLAKDLTKAAESVRRHNNPNQVRKLGEF